VIGIDNRSGFPAELLSIPDLDGQEIPLLIVSSTWVHSDPGAWIPAPDPPPICFSDEYFGEPSPYSSVKYEAQTATEKIWVDVVVNGSAYAPGGKPARAVTVELHAGDINKEVRVFGDRSPGLGLSLPEKFVTMPVVYERAFGGSNTSHPDPRKHSVWRRNPAGIGYRGAKSKSIDIQTDYPNLEPANGNLEGPPAGFGVISRGWSPRLEFAGTFDENWQDEQWPLLPKDFDIRHYQAAPPDQQVASLKTGDPVRLVNFTADGLWDFDMPSTDLETWLICDGGMHEAAPRMDMVLIEPDQRRVKLLFRINLARENREDRIREILIGPVTRGYLRAKERNKAYFDMKDLRVSVKDDS
jgi:hypothetical protein